MVIHYKIRVIRENKVNKDNNLISEEPFETHFLSDRAEWVNSFLPEHFRGLTLTDYSVRYPGYAEITASAAHYVQDVLQGHRHSLVLYGDCDSGKTMLASIVFSAIATFIADRSRYQDLLACGTADNIAFVIAAKLPGMFRGKTDDGQPGIPHLSSCYLLVLDDLDKCARGEWGNELLALIDARVCQKLPTIVTMNTTPAEFEKRYGVPGEAIISRFKRTGSLFIRVGGAS